MPHGALLARVAEAVALDDEEAMSVVRAEVIDAMGEAALVDAVAVSASFHMMNRVADGTGTPLDEMADGMTEELRADLGLDELTTARRPS